MGRSRPRLGRRRGDRAAGARRARPAAAVHHGAPGGPGAVPDRVRANPGSAAAPTAGLHFTPELLARVEAMGVALARVRLDVGLGTFRPVRVEDVREHEMHREAYAVPPEAARAINECRGRVWAAGTTVVRALETAAQRAREAGNGNRVEPGAGETAIFIYPGHVFRGVDAIITNFHQPHSTLLLLVAAFLGRDQMRRAYAAALGDGYRFLSFGDAMLCL